MHAKTLRAKGRNSYNREACWRQCSSPGHWCLDGWMNAFAWYALYSWLILLILRQTPDPEMVVQTWRNWASGWRHLFRHAVLNLVAPAQPRDGTLCARSAAACLKSMNAFILASRNFCAARPMQPLRSVLVFLVNVCVLASSERTAFLILGQAWTGFARQLRTLWQTAVVASLWNWSAHSEPVKIWSQ